MKFHHFFTCISMVVLLLAPYVCIAICPAFPVRCYFMDESTKLLKLVDLPQTAVEKPASEFNFKCVSPSARTVCDRCKKITPDSSMKIYSIEYVTVLYSSESDQYPDANKGGVWEAARCQKK